MVGMAKLVTQTPLYYMPDKKIQRSLLNNLSEEIYPRINSKAPVLLEIWKKSSGEIQYHLVNYDSKRQTIQLIFPDPSSGSVIVPTDIHERKFTNQDQITIDLDIYAICILKDILS